MAPDNKTSSGKKDLNDLFYLNHCWMRFGLYPRFLQHLAPPSLLGHTRLLETVAEKPISL